MLKHEKEYTNKWQWLNCDDLNEHTKSWFITGFFKSLLSYLGKHLHAAKGYQKSENLRLDFTNELKVYRRSTLAMEYV